MIFTWDEPKRNQNIAKHGLDFAAFESAFDFETAITTPAKSGRSRIIGRWDKRFVVAAIVAPLGGEATALVSLRHASTAERMLYEQQKR